MPRVGVVSRVEREKVLFAANGFCCFPHCAADLADYLFDHDMAPKVSHIVAASDEGPRGDASMPDEERNKSENLILLCDDHARAVDVLPVTQYTAAALRQMKTAHEARCTARRAIGQTWNGLVGEPNYVNLNRLFMDATPNTHTIGPISTALSPPQAFETMPSLEFGYYMTFVERTVAMIERRATPLMSADDLIERNEGRRFIFWRRFRTKSVYGRRRRPDTFRASYENRPHIYTTIGDVRIIMPVDVRWVTSSSAKGLFSDGSVNFVGVASLRSAEQTRAIMSPIVLGKPADGAWERFAALRAGTNQRQ